MKIEIKVPAMGESISEATIGEIFKAPGSLLQMDDEILELETDKVNQSLFAKEAGRLELTVKKEDKVTVGQVIGFIDTDAKGNDAKPQEASKESKASKAVEKKEEVAKGSKKAISEAVPKEPSSGKGVRISKEDFLKEEEDLQKKSPEEKPIERAAPIQAPQEGPLETRNNVQEEPLETRKKMSKIRRVIAERLVQAKQEIAMLTTFNEVDLFELMAIRERYKDVFLKKYGVKLGLMSFFVKAAIKALKAIPEVNAYIERDEIVYRNYYNIGVAVSLDNGLIVPVIKGADKLSFAEIEKTIVNLAEKAREGKLSVDDLQGGGFTITNGGIFGSLLSTPIVNPPQSAILGMHTIKKRPVVLNDEIVIRPMMYLALSYDHRIIDGKEAVTFLVMIKEALEDPSRLLLDL